MADCIQQIRIDEITVPPGQRELRNLDELINSIQTLGLLQPVLVVPEGSHYRLIAGWHRYTACKRLGWLEIRANILALDDPRMELAKIDENLVRQELTILERGEQYRRQKEIYETLHPETKHGNGPGRGHQEKKRNKFVSFTADTAAKTGRDKRTIQQEVQIATDLSDGVKEIIRSLPIAGKKTELLHLARLPQKTQEAITALLESGDAKSVREAQRALNANAGAPDPTPGTRRSPRGQTLAPQPAGVKVDGEDRDTLRHTVMAHFQQFSAITESQIAGRPAADVMAERLAALPRPELILLRALVVGQVQEAAASWVAAVRADVQNGVDPFEGVMQLDCHGDSADAPDVHLVSGDDQAETAAFPDVVAHPSMGDTARSSGQGTSAAVMEVRDDDADDAEVGSDGNQLHLPWSGEEQLPGEQALALQENEKPSAQEPSTDPSRPARTRTRLSKAKGLAASTMGELTGPVPGASATLTEISGSANDADPVEPCSPDVLLNTHCPDQDCSEQSSGSQGAYFDGSSRLISPKPMGSAGAGDLPTANVPMTASAAPLPPCPHPQCGSSKTWPIYGAPAGRFACLDCQHHFDASTHGNVPSIQSQVSSHEIVQVASEERPEESGGRDKQQNPLAPVSAMGSVTQDEIAPGPSEATVNSTVRGGAFGDENTAHQAPPAGPRDDGETL